MPVATVRSLCLIAACVTLGLALQVYDGLYDPWALALLIATLLLFAASFFARTTGLSQRTFTIVLLLANLVQLFAGFFRNAGATHSYMPPDSQGPYHAGLIAAALGLASVAWRARLTRFAAIYLLIVFATIGVWKIRSAPKPNIDVYNFQTDGPAALVRGIDPYTITFPNIYEADTPVYGPGIVKDGRLQFGYPYPPLCLYWITPAARLLGDFRYAQLLALLIAGVLLCLMIPGPVGVMSAALLLFSPRTFYVIESGWTEPLSILLMTAMFWSYLRRSRWTLGWFGLFVASKQYLPVTLLLMPAIGKRSISSRESLGGEETLSPNAGRGSGVASALLAAGIAIAVSVPLVLWNVPAFIHSALTLQLHQPFREDALSLLNPWAGFVPHRDALASVAFALATGWAYVVYRRGLRGYRSLAGQLLLLFAFNKQAFANYYELVIAALLLAAIDEFVQNRASTADRTLSDYAHAPPADSPVDARVGAARAADRAHTDDQTLRL